MYVLEVTILHTRERCHILVTGEWSAYYRPMLRLNVLHISY